VNCSGILNRNFFCDRTGNNSKTSHFRLMVIREKEGWRRKRERQLWKKEERERLGTVWRNEWREEEEEVEEEER